MMKLMRADRYKVNKESSTTRPTMPNDWLDASIRVQKSVKRARWEVRV